MRHASLVNPLMPQIQYPLRHKQSSPLRRNDNILLERENLPLENHEGTASKMSVPIKQYSNKFLRDSKRRDKEEENLAQAMTPQRLSSLVRANKQLLQKKYNRVLTRRNQNCKTEPNECQLVAFPHFQPKMLDVRVKTESMFSRDVRDCPSLPKGERSMEEEFISASSSKPLKREKKSLTFTHKNLNKKQEIGLFTENVKSRSKQKISTSRGLEMYSKVFLKEKTELPQKLRKQHQKKRSEKGNSGSNNLEAKQMTLLDKSQRHASIERKMPPKSIIKHRARINSDIRHIFKQEPQQHFELRGWETSN